MPAREQASLNTVWPYATAASEAVSSTVNGWKGLRFTPLRSAADITKAVIEVGIVGSQHRALASVAANLAANEPKQRAHRFFLAQRIAVRIGQINPGDLERGVLDPRPRVGNDVPALDFLDVQPAVRPDEAHGRNLQHGVDILVETTGFEIDYDGKEAAKSGAHFAHRRPCKPRGQACVQAYIS